MLFLICGVTCLFGLLFFQSCSLCLCWLIANQGSSNLALEGQCAAEFSSNHDQMALFHCMVRHSSARLGTVRLSSGRFAFPLQFSTAIEWAGLFMCRYNCAASTAVTSS